jgi:hypothetical protein
MSDVKGEVEAFQLLKQDSAVTIYIGSVSQHRDATLPGDYQIDEKWSFTGQAYVKRLTITANKGSKVALSLEFEGTGEPEWHYADWVLATGTWNDSGVWINTEKWINS